MGDRAHCKLFKNGVDWKGDFCRMSIDCDCVETPKPPTTEEMMAVWDKQNETSEEEICVRW